MPENHELDSYGIQASAEGSSSSRPLLSRDPSPPPSPSRRGRPYPVASHGYPSIHSTYRRLWKPIVILSIPFLLVFLYSLVHPHVKGLPPLPKISITSGGAVSQPYYEEKIVQDCICGATDEGKRLCSLYHEEGLRNSRLIEGTGARIRKVLQKARNGEKIKIGVLGGSGKFRQDI